MSLSDLANLGEFLSSIAVLASLIYLAVQVHDAKRNQRASIQSDRATRIVGMLLHLGEEANMGIFNGGNSGDGITTANELMRYQVLFGAGLYSMEDTFLQHRAGLIDDDEFEGLRARIRTNFTQVGWRVMWKQQRAFVSERFRNFIDETVRDIPLKVEGDPVADWHKALAAERAASAG